MTMKWESKEKEYIVDENYQVVCYFPDTIDYRTVRMIESTPELVDAVEDFTLSLEAGSVATKAVYNKFKILLARIGRA